MFDPTMSPAERDARALMVVALIGPTLIGWARRWLVEGGYGAWGWPDGAVAVAVDNLFVGGAEAFVEAARVWGADRL